MSNELAQRERRRGAHNQYRTLCAMVETLHQSVEKSDSLDTPHYAADLQRVGSHLLNAAKILWSLVDDTTEVNLQHAAAMHPKPVAESER